MRWVITLLSVFGALLFPSNVVAADSSPEFIESFSTTIRVDSNQSLQVQEKIVYSTSLPKHGIFRYIPLRYQRDGKTVVMPPRAFKVTSEVGESIPFSQSRDGDNVTLKIGKASETFTGSKIYLISYVVDNALLENSEGLRLYWDITGEGWSFPILKSEAKVFAPSGIIKETTCYSGEFGSNNKQCISKPIDSKNAEFRYDQVVDYGQNFTIDVQFDGSSGFIILSPAQKLLRQVLAYWWVIVFIAPLVIFFQLWNRYGRDHMYLRYNPYDHSKRTEVKAPIFTKITPPFVYEPLDISPGQAGAMLDESYDNHDLVADILDLGHRKYLTIKQLQKKTLFKAADYEFNKLKAGDRRLPIHQQLILTGIFADSDSVKLSELKGKFYTHIPKIREALFAELFSNTFFTRNPWELKKVVALGSFGILGIAYLLFQIGLPLIILFFPIILVAVLVGVNIVAAVVLIIKLTQKTGKGFNYMLLAKGLRETILRGKWREEIKEKQLFIEEILPFAVSLNVVDKLSRDMKDLGLEPPKYVGGSHHGIIATSALVSGFSSDVASGLAYNPSSSSSGGGSFGGGSSGGGGGGGGGGSW